MASDIVLLVTDCLHDDPNPDMSIRRSEWLVKCVAGCFPVAELPTHPRSHVTFPASR